MTAKQDVEALVAEHGGEVEDTSVGIHINIIADLPAGKVWNATGAHIIVAAHYAGKGAKPAAWRQLLEDVRQGVGPCDQPDCDICERYSTDTPES